MGSLSNDEYQDNRYLITHCRTYMYIVDPIKFAVVAGIRSFEHAVATVLDHSAAVKQT